MSDSQKNQMENTKIKIVALFAPAGAGKDTVLKTIKYLYEEDYISLPSFNVIVSCTTRPPRENELDCVDYFFLSDEEFEDLKRKNQFLESCSFRDWHYGTAYNYLEKDKINFGVFNISGIKQLLEKDDIDVLPILIYANDKTRLLRQLSREENPNCEEICRRFFTDQLDFENIPFDFYKVNNGDSIDTTVTASNIVKIVNEYFG